MNETIPLLVVIITTTATMVTAVLSTVVAVITLLRMFRVGETVDLTHSLVNSTATKTAEELTGLRQEVVGLKVAAAARSGQATV